MRLCDPPADAHSAADSQHRPPSPTAEARASSSSRSSCRILLFLTLIALDFGRVYLGWINLQSMTRIAANLAANNPTAWQGGGDADVQAKYQNQIRNDAAATNCTAAARARRQRRRRPPSSAIRVAMARADDIGDSATVSLSCTFDLITPGIKNIFGGRSRCPRRRCSRSRPA